VQKTEKIFSLVQISENRTIKFAANFRARAPLRYWHGQCDCIEGSAHNERSMMMKNGKEGTVREIMMGSPVTLKPGDTLDLANDIIAIGRIRHIPVVEEGKLVGLLSERDLLGATATRIFGISNKSRSALLKSTRIKDVMKKRVVTVEPDTPIKDAARLMADKKIGCVPVLSDGGVVGLVTTTNILRYVESFA
jgi:CBS-domain-containing membrane protein